MDYMRVNLVLALTDLSKDSKFVSDWMKTDQAWINTERLSLIHSLIAQAQRRVTAEQNTSKHVTLVEPLQTILQANSSNQSMMTQINSSIVEMMLKCIVEEDNDIMNQFYFGTAIEDDKISNNERNDICERASKIFAQKNRS